MIRVLLILILGVFAAPQVSFAAMQEIVAVVNADAISARDLAKRLHLVVTSSGLPDNKEVRQRLMPQVLNGLINEALMIQEASRVGISVTEEDVDEGFSRIAQQNKVSVDKFRSMLNASRVDLSTLRDQVRAQMAWSKFVQSRLRRQVLVSERDIDDALERMSSKMGSVEYLTAEIFLPFEDAKSEKDAARLAKRLSGDIRSGRGSFFKLARQFSKAAGSAQGGDSGWLNETQIEPEILQGLSKVKKNQITSAIKTSSGYHILFLRDKRQVDESTLPSREQIGNVLGSQRLEKVQRRHLQDLKAASFVDIRV